MATPTASGPTKPGPQNAATPTSHPHLGPFSSPAPRGVPSPAITVPKAKAAAGKSPFNIASSKEPSVKTAAMLTATANLHNPPTGGTLGSLGSIKLNESSPAAGFLNTDSPAAFLDSIANMTGGLPMGLGMSGLSNSIGAIATRANTDEEVRRRLVDIVAGLATRMPRISLEGVKTLAERMKMITQVEEDRKTGDKTLTIAGNTVLIDVIFNPEQDVVGAEVLFPTSSEVVTDQATAASALIRGNLVKRNKWDTMTKNLSQFAQNFDYLARMDKLSGQPTDPTFNCFEAITGVHQSLKRLFEHEKALALKLMDASKGNTDARAEREVMCKKSGRPCLHERGKVGLRLDYWMQKRHVFRQRRRDNEDIVLAESNGDSMEVDGAPAPMVDEGDEVFSLLIECDELKATSVEQPARISDAWLAEPVEQPIEIMLTDATAPMSSTSAINWSNPPPTYMKPPESNTALTEDSLNNINKLPNIRFTAKLDPPLVVQYYLQPTVEASTGAVQAPYETPTRSFASLLLKPKDPEDIASSLMHISKEFCRQSKIISDCPPSAAGGPRESIEHHNSLWTSKPDVAKVLTEIPFSHPQELVQLLPLLQASFAGDARETPAKNDFTASSGESLPARNVDVDLCSQLEPKPRLNIALGTIFTSSSLQHNDAKPTLSLDDLLSDQTEEEDSKTSSDGNPSFSQVGPTSITFEILPNADIQIVSHSFGGGAMVNGAAASDEKVKAMRYKLAKALDVCGDLGIWGEWVDRNREKLVASL